MEENVSLRHEDKLRKYTELVPAAAANGWQMRVQPVEVGCLGHVAKSMSKVLQQLHFTRQEATRTKKQISDTARRCSYTLYLHRRQAGWKSAPLMSGLMAELDELGGGGGGEKERASSTTAGDDAGDKRTP